jgi:hypothetical protein
MPFWADDSLAALKSIPGGGDLLALFDSQVPTFGDAEVLTLQLNQTGPSTLLVHETLKDMWVTFTMTEISDLDLDDFSPQNVIRQLDIRLLHETPESFGLQWIKPPPARSLYEIRLESLYGLGGTIRARHVTIRVSPVLKSL